MTQDSMEHWHLKNVLKEEKTEKESSKILSMWFPLHVVGQHRGKYLAFKKYLVNVSI